jgi:hypothetical protein
LPQVAVPAPFGPQLRVLLGVQEPWFEHVVTKCHVAVSLSHMLDCVPQLPHARVGGSPAHFCFMHAVGH